MEGDRSPTRHHNPSAARAIALIRQAVAEAEARVRVSPSPTLSPSPSPSPSPLPSSQAAYLQQHHAHEGPGFGAHTQGGHIQQEGWIGTQHRPGFSPGVGPGPISGGQDAYPQLQQPHAGAGHGFGRGEAQQSLPNSGSLSSSSSSRHTGSGLDLRGQQHPYPQPHWNQGGPGPAMVSQQPTAFPSPPSQDPLSHPQPHHLVAATGYWPPGGGDPAHPRPGPQPLLGSSPAPSGALGTRPWQQQVAQQPLAGYGGAAVPSPATGPGIPQVGASRAGVEVPFLQAPGGQYHPPASTPFFQPQPLAYTRPNVPGASRPSALSHPPELPYPYTAGSQHAHSIPHRAAEAVPATVDHQVTGHAPSPGTWHSMAPNTGWHYTSREPAQDQLGQASQLPSAPPAPFYWPTEDPRAQGLMPRAAVARAGQERPSLAVAGGGAGAAALPREVRAEGLAPFAQPLHGEQPPSSSTMKQAPPFNTEQHPSLSSLTAGGQRHTNDVPARESSNEFSMGQLSGGDWMSPALQAWGLDGEGGLEEEADSGEARTEAGLEGQGGQVWEVTLGELDADFGEEMEGEWMDGSALQGSPARAATVEEAPSAAAAQAPAEQAAAYVGDPWTGTQAVARAELAGLEGTRNASGASEQPLGHLGREALAQGPKQPHNEASPGAVERGSAGGMQRRSVAAGAPGKRQPDSLDSAATRNDSVARDVASADSAAAQGQSDETGRATEEAAPKVNVRLQNRNRVLLPPDGHFWTKYGEKLISSESITRSYFKCSLTKSHACSAKKVVDFSTNSPLSVAPRIQYNGTHSHPPPPQEYRIRPTAPDNNQWGPSQTFHVTSVPTAAASSPRKGVPREPQVQRGAKPPGDTRHSGRAADRPRRLQASRSAQGPGRTKGALQAEEATGSRDAIGSTETSSEEAKDVSLTHTRSLSE